MITKDDLIGEAKIPMHELTQQRTTNNWYPLFERDGKPAGQILIGTEFQPFGSNPNNYSGNLGIA